jgi:D-alanyl-D-alanine carboxypeptidase
VLDANTGETPRTPFWSIHASITKLMTAMVIDASFPRRGRPDLIGDLAAKGTKSRLP